MKVGGAQLEEAPRLAAFARAVARARSAGHQVVLVHGGGNQIRSLSRRLGIQDRYHQGLCVTDAATAEVVLMVLGGQVNRTVVQALQSAGVPAVGITGADGATFAAVKHAPDGVDLGYVGAVHAPDPGLVRHLLAGGFVPVIATTAPGPDGVFHNINADMGAGPLARAFAAEALLFLTDVPGVLDHERRRLEVLSPTTCARLRQSGVIHGGMIPKVEAALAALAENPAALIKIAPAEGEDTVLHALDPAVGTRFCNEKMAHG